MNIVENQSYNKLIQINSIEIRSSFYLLHTHSGYIFFKTKKAYREFRQAFSNID